MSTASRFLFACRTLLLLAFALGFNSSEVWAQAQSLPGSGNSLLFNGTSSYVDCGPTNREIRQQVSVQVWVKTRSAAYQGIVSKFSDGDAEDKGFYLYTSGGRAGFSGRNGSGQLMSSGLSNARIDDGRWHHVTGTCSQGTWYVIVDGILENTGTYSAAGAGLASSAPLLIGCDYAPNGHFFDGEIDELFITTYPHNQYDVRRRMCIKYTTAPQGVSFNYRFDHNSGTTLVDNGSRPADGVLIHFGSNSWRTSGAPIGDASLALYQDERVLQNLTWQMTSPEGDTIFLGNISAGTRGALLYFVNEPPSIAPGGPAAGVYFGVFTVGNPATSSYTLRIRPATGAGCRNAYARLSNEMQWVLPAPLPTSRNRLLLPTTYYRSEHILTRGPETTAAITGDSVVCAGSRATLSVVGPGIVSVRWNTGETTPTVSVGPGTYTATVAFASGCSRELQQRVRTITAALAITGDSALCSGRTTTLSATAPGAVSYRWNTGATTAAIQLVPAGTYTVTAVYANGCTATAQRTIRLSTSVVLPFSLGADTTLCDGESFVLRGPIGMGLRYLWSDGSAGGQLRVRAAGRYTLRVLAPCGEQFAARTVALRACLKVPNIITANADARNDHFAVQGLSGEGWTLEIYNRWGRAVFQTANYHNDWGPAAAPGLYYVQLRRPATGYAYKGWLEVVR